MDPTGWTQPSTDLPPAPRRRRVVDLWVTAYPYTTAVFPVPDILATRTFRAVFPDRVPHTRIPIAGGAFAPPLVPANLLPLSWRATFPDRVPTRHLPLGVLQVAEPPAGAITSVATALAWRAVFPDELPRRRSLLQTAALGGQGWGFSGPLDPSLMGTVCVALGLEAGTTPALLADAVASPAFIGEGLASPALVAEDLC